MIRKLIIVLSVFFITALTTVNAQVNFNLAFTPAVSVGYNLGVGVFGAVDLSSTFVNYNTGKLNNNAGLNFSIAWFYGKHVGVKADKGIYKVLSANIYNNINNQFYYKLGLAKTSVRWGLADVNKSESKQLGLNVDIAYSPFKNNAYAGFRAFVINNKCMGLDVISAKVPYLNYSYPVNLYPSKR